MRIHHIAALLTIIGTSAAFGQQPYAFQATDQPRFDVAVGYNYTGANAPPAVCNCFGMNGAFVSGNFQAWDWLGLTGKVTANHATDISSLGQNLTLMTFMGGPKISLPNWRLEPFGEVLFGAARGTGSYFPSGTSSTTSASSFALSTGGGFDFSLSPRIGIRALDVQYVRTGLPNGVGNNQNQLQIGAGLIIKFQGHSESEEGTAPLTRRSDEVALTCSTNLPEVTAGDPIQINAEADTLPGNQQVTYTWITTGGLIQGTGRSITIDTNGLAAGVYEVSGHAVLISDPSVGDDCSATFRVTPRVEQPATPNETSTDAAQSPNTADNQEFRQHVKDAFFDYDMSNLRPDAQQAVIQDTSYLLAHPDLQITIAGYADERGSAEFNLALGLDRATATRDALIAGGVSPSRIQVVTYGKERPFCTEDAESCYQQNRRAQLLLDK